MSLKDEMQKIRMERESLSQKIRAMAGQVFAEEAKNLFETYPKLNSFSWTQYTPYFNDGEPCEFDVYRDYLDVTDVDGNEEDVSIWSVKRYLANKVDFNGNPYTATDLELSAIAASKFLDEFEDNDLLMMFGDHTRVTVYRDGKIDTDDYDHD